MKTTMSEKMSKRLTTSAMPVTVMLLISAAPIQ